MIIFTGYGAVGSALVWGARGREFKSRCSEYEKKREAVSFWAQLFKSLAEIQEEKDGDKSSCYEYYC